MNFIRLPKCSFCSGDQQHSSPRIQQFITSASSSKLGGYLGKLSEQDRHEFGLRYLRDFVLLSFKVQSEKELAVSVCLHRFLGFFFFFFRKNTYVFRKYF